MSIIYSYFGFFGPYILTLISLFYIIKFHNKYVLLYIICQFFNVVLNFILKNLLKDPRPDNEEKFIDIQRLNIDKYGMPSGHAQTAWYNIGIIMLIDTPFYIKILSIIIACLTIYQRYIFNNHTILQLAVGTVIGLLVAFISHYSIKLYDCKYNSQV